MTRNAKFEFDVEFDAGYSRDTNRLIAFGIESFNTLSHSASRQDRLEHEQIIEHLRRLKQQGFDVNRVLDRSILHGVLKTRQVTTTTVYFLHYYLCVTSHITDQCLGILELSAAPETVPDVGVFVPLLQHEIIKDHVSPTIQTTGASLFTSFIPDPAMTYSIGGLSTFRGLFGCQMLSFSVQVVHICNNDTFSCFSLSSFR